MKFLMAFLPPGDRRIFLAWILLCLASLALLWSVTEPIKGPYELLDPVVAKGIFYRQMIWMMISYVALLGASRLPLRFLENMAVPMFIFSVLLLAFILATGPRIGGARRWLVLGPMHFQASELAKVAFILMMAQFLDRGKEAGRGLSVTLGSFLLMLIPLTLAFHQLIEAGAWWSLEGRVPEVVGSVSIYIYLAIALVVVPILIPYAVRNVEPNPRRRRWMTPFLAVGVFTGVALGVLLVTGPVSA